MRSKTRSITVQESVGLPKKRKRETADFLCIVTNLLENLFGVNSTDILSFLRPKSLCDVDFKAYEEYITIKQHYCVEYCDKSCNDMPEEVLAEYKALSEGRGALIPPNLHLTKLLTFGVSGNACNFKVMGVCRWVRQKVEVFTPFGILTCFGWHSFTSEHLGPFFFCLCEDGRWLAHCCLVDWQVLDGKWVWCSEAPRHRQEGLEDFIMDIWRECQYYEDKELATDPGFQSMRSWAM